MKFAVAFVVVAHVFGGELAAVAEERVAAEVPIEEVSAIQRRPRKIVPEPKLFSDVRYVNRYAISPDRKQIVVARRRTSAAEKKLSQYAIEAWDLQSGRKLRDFEAPAWVTGQIQFSPDGRLLAARLRNNSEIRIWDAITGEVTRHFRSAANIISNGFGFSDDSQMLVITALYNFMVLDLASGKTRLFPFQNRTLSDSVAVSPTGPFAAVGRYNRSSRQAFIDVFDLRTMLRVCKLNMPSVAIQNLAFSADGTKLVASGKQSAIVIIDAEQWRIQKTIERPATLFGKSSRQYLKLAVSRDGSYVAGLPLYGGRPKPEVWDVTAGTARQFGRWSPTDMGFIDNSLFVVCPGVGAPEFFATASGKKVGPPKPIPFLTPRALPDLYGALPKVHRLVAYRKLGEFQKAIDVGAPLVAGISEKELSKNLAALHQTRMLAESYRAVGDFPRAVASFRKCLAVTEAAISIESTSCSSDLHGLMRTYVSMGQWKLAAKLIESTAKARASKFGKRHPAVAHAEFEFGTLAWLAGDWSTARVHFQKSLSIRESTKVSAYDLADSLMWTGMTYSQSLDFAKAVPLMSKAVATLRPAVKLPNVLLAQAEMRLADVYMKSGEDRQFRVMFGSAFRSLQKIKDADTPAFVYTFRRLAENLTALKRYNEAEVLLHKALAMVRRLYGPRDVAVAEFYSEMAWNHYSVGLFETSNLYQRRAVDIYQKLFGDDFPRKAYHLELLGRTYLRIGRHETGHDILKRVVADADTSTMDGQDASARALLYRSSDLTFRQKLDEALPVCDASVRKEHADLVRLLPLLPDTVKAQYAERAMGRLDYSISVVYDLVRNPKTRPTVQKWIDRSAEWVINMKGLPTEILANRALLLRDAGDKKTRALAQELASVRNRIAAGSAGNIGRFAFGAQAEQVKTLMRRERELSAELGRLMGPKAVGVPWISIDDVRKRLPPDTILVEFVKFDYKSLHDRRRGWRMRPVTETTHYFAWVIPPAGRGNVRYTWVAAASDIDNDITSFYATLKADSESGNFSAENIASAADAMSARVLHRAIRPLMNFRRWLISPDASMWMVPWGAVRTLKKEYAIKSREVCTITTSRSLLRPKSKVKTTAPVILANPNYNLGLPAGLGGIGGFTPLPGTATEAKAATPLLQKYAGTKPAVYLQNAATEKVAKGLKSPRVVLFSTHGFFDRGNPSTHPLLRSGLALAGANNAAAGFFNKPNAEQTATGNDGILTALEVMSLDFRGTQLAVLSACETGLGTRNRGQGVAGLHQAFRLAGAENVAATLWSIPDKQTARLSSELFRQLANGKRPTEALRQAQLSMLNNKATSHPFYWAAFTISGFSK